MMNFFVENDFVVERGGYLSAPLNHRAKKKGDNYDRNTSRKSGRIRTMP
jgi:hypothetical protein